MDSKPLPADGDLQARVTMDMLISLTVGEHDVRFLLSEVLAHVDAEHRATRFLTTAVETLIDSGDAECGVFVPTSWTWRRKAKAWEWRTRKGSGRDIAEFIRAEMSRPENLTHDGRLYPGAVGYLSLTELGRARGDEAIALRSASEPDVSVATSRDIQQR